MTTSPASAPASAPAPARADADAKEPDFVLVPETKEPVSAPTRFKESDFARASLKHDGPGAPLRAETKEPAPARATDEGARLTYLPVALVNKCPGPWKRAALPTESDEPSDDEDDEEEEVELPSQKESHAKDIKQPVPAPDRADAKGPDFALNFAFLAFFIAGVCIGAACLKAATDGSGIQTVPGRVSVPGDSVGARVAASAMPKGPEVQPPSLYKQMFDRVKQEEAEIVELIRKNAEMFDQQRKIQQEMRKEFETIDKILPDIQKWINEKEDQHRPVDFTLNFGTIGKLSVRLDNTQYQNFMGLFFLLSFVMIFFGLLFWAVAKTAQPSKK